MRRNGHPLLHSLCTFLHARKPRENCHCHWIPSKLSKNHVLSYIQNMIHCIFHQKFIKAKFYAIKNWCYVFLQIPCFETRNDGLDNIIGALILAGKHIDIIFWGMELWTCVIPSNPQCPSFLLPNLNFENIMFVEMLHWAVVHNRLL